MRWERGEESWVSPAWGLEWRALEGRGEVELCLEPLLWEVCSTDLQGGEHRGEMVVTFFPSAERG